MKKIFLITILILMNCTADDINSQKAEKIEADQVIALLLESSKAIPKAYKYIPSSEIVNATQIITSSSNPLGIATSQLPGGTSNTPVSIGSVGGSTGANATNPIPQRVLLSLSDFTVLQDTSSKPTQMELKYKLTMNVVLVNNEVKIAAQCSVNTSTSYVDQTIVDMSPEDRASYMAHEQMRIDLCYGYAKLFKVQLENHYSTVGYATFATQFSSMAVEKINQLKIKDEQLQLETSYGSDAENESAWQTVVAGLL